jgi:hypothetical protein
MVHGIGNEDGWFGYKVVGRKRQNNENNETISAAASKM